MSGGLMKWRFAFACSFINFTVLAQIRIAGLQFVATLERYDVSRSQAAFPYVLRYIVAFVCGPFIGFFGCKFGFKPVTLSGCCLLSFGIGLCFFAEDVIVITIGWGLLNGLGSGMACHLLPSYMSLHFAPEDLARANGLAMTGASLGGFVYPPLYEYLSEEFGTSGAFLLLAACSLHNIPGAMLLSSGPSRTAKNASTNCKTSIQTFDNFTGTRSCTKAETVHLVCKDNVRVTGEMEDNRKVNKNVQITESEEPTPLENSIFHWNGLNKVNDYVEPNEKYVIIPEDSLKDVVAVAYEDKNTRRDLHETIKTLPVMTSVKDVQDSLDRDEKQYEGNKNNLNNPIVPLSMIQFGEGHTELQRQQQEKDQATETLLVNPNEPLAALSFGGEDLHFHTKQPEKDETAEKLLNNNAIEFRPVAARQSPGLPSRTKPRTFESLRVLYSTTFILMTIIQSSFMCIATLHSTVLVDFAKDKGVTTDQSVHMLMCSAVANLAGCLTLGFVTDKSWLSATQFAALCYFCYGLSATAFALSSNFFGMVLSAALSSFVAGGQLLTFPVLVSQYFDKENRNIAMTSRFVLFCPMSFAAAPLIGQVRDGIGSYEWVFYSMHIFSIFASVLILLMPFVARHRK
ncbi:hypothetical protein JTE90_018359 [Oedothorax gibbosus]|uniref:Major facilitator superfamily (MFS) profile domain-containing protein n=1 Tax=Oedothorax gibbosus TaxID=931172 RepID=A0AAV6TZZ6_9ARAC|nr:hypothetical protein JTE90_018359 [Oedothorax gibbosus]